jgi:anti-sigma regulatory factor (Ser/Thr protein kinase)
MTPLSRPSEVSRVFPAVLDSLGEICVLVTQTAQDAQLGPQAVYAVQVAVDEACSNIIEHAYGGRGLGSIRCTCRILEDRLVIELQDHGCAFDPAKVPKPDLEAELSDRPAGGLGVYFIKQLMDDVQFESNPQEGNKLTLTKYRETAP